MKKLLRSIPTSRLVVYLAILGLLPFLYIGYAYGKVKKEWNQVTERILAVHTLSEHKARKQAINSAVRKQFGNADQFYLDHQIETLSFLKKEREALENLIQNPSFTGNEAAEKRYAYLLGEGNRLSYTEGSVQSGEGLQETTEIQAHPIEVDTQDLKELLARLEGNRPGKPQLIITDFRLSKKAHSNGNQVFELNTKLLKREFIQ